ncbi:SH3 domain-containing protein [Spirillospora sp. CA-128828]|uniref:SH3 domain-containing protein n=1 Tax=Spirillospora sp. CA-128828 TaxID=3240033 RepID=UPI003D9129CD
MSTNIRSGLALSLSGLALTGLVAAGPAAGASVTEQRTVTSASASVAAPPAQQVRVCRYVVVARHGLRIHRRPSIRSRVIGHLRFRQRVLADCRSHRGWVHLRAGKHGWVARAFLRRI